MRVEPNQRGFRPRALRAAAAGGAVLLLAQGGLWLGVEPIATWSYDLSWWSLILLLDGLVHARRGASMLLSRPGAFFALAIASATFWLLYECANLRLENWYYVGIPDDPLTRSVGVFVSFATVLPGVIEIHAFLSPSERPGGEAHAPGRTARKILLGLGAACLVLPLLFPDVAYPLIWGAAFLLLEPWLAPRDARSLLGRWTSGDRAPLFRLLAAGAIAGALWEAWNWRSPAKWIYTVPFFEEGKLFEMPYLGFVGFVPFALGCHSFARALVVLGCIPEWDPAAPAVHRFIRSRALVSLLAGLGFSAAAIAGVNRFTVHATRPGIADVPGLTPEAEERLDQAGIRSLEDLASPAERSHVAAALAGFDAGDRSKWIEAARLMTVRGMGRRGRLWLAGVGVESVQELGTSEPASLHRALIAARTGPLPAPSLPEVRVWIRGAHETSP